MFQTYEYFCLCMFFRTSTRNDIVSVFHLQKSCLSGIHFFLTLPMKSLLKFSIRGREGKGREFSWRWRKTFDYPVCGKYYDGQFTYVISIKASCFMNSFLLFKKFSLVAQSCPTLCDPMDWSTPAFPVHHQLPELAQTHVHQVGDDIQPSHPLAFPYSPAFNISQHQGLF